jgi:hypothetical protein
MPGNSTLTKFLWCLSLFQAEGRLGKSRCVLRTLQTTGAVLVLGISIGACVSLPAFGGNSWKEEVLLHDGGKIIVERSQTYGGRHEIGQSSPVREHTVTFTLPSSGETISWTSEYGADLGRTNFNLLALHVLNGTPYLVVEPNLCLSYNKWGRPNPPYVVFKYDRKVWQRMPLSELPAEFKTVNLDFGMPWDIRDRKVKFDKGNLLTAETIKRHNEGNSQPEYKTILREPTQSAGRDCPEMIRKGNGGWDGIGWFRDQPSKEACFKYCEREEVSAQDCPCNRFFK